MNAALALFLGLLLGASSPARAQPDGLDPAVATFVLGNVQFLLAHELAHLVIGELGVPVLGPEENAADYLAATALIRAERRDPERNARNGDYLLAAADAQRMSWERGTELGAPVPYWDSHALTIQRFFQIACLLYGANPETYAELPARIGMPAARSSGCAAEFERANRALDWVVAEFGRQPGDPPGAEVAIRYDAPPTLASRAVLEEMGRVELVEAVVARVGEIFRLPRPVTVAVRRCGRAEAAWQPDRRELAVCFEMLDGFYRMGADAARGGKP
jgi:hypothetical protein